MKKLILIVSLLILVVTLSACQTSIQCGAGTTYSEGRCIVAGVIEDEDPTDNEDPDYNEDPIDNEEPVDNTPSNAIELLANQDFTDSDTSLWVTEGNVTLSHDTDGYLVANVSSFTGEFYQDNFALSNLGTQENYTYTVTIIAKTDVTTGRNVQFFLEDTDAGFLKFFIHQEYLTTSFQTFTYTYVSTQNNNDTKLGVFIGNLPDSEPGSVIIDSITVTKEEGLMGTMFEDLNNADFSNSDLSDWTKEGNVEITHDANGYLVANVSSFTGNFWEENITYRNLIIESWTNYTVELVIKSDVSRDVTLFVEDTDAGFFKYADVTQTVTTEWTTITLTFRPTESNADTTLGLFLGDMENAELGSIYIDSITITSEPTF